jgi:hypothetical protein
LEFREIAPIDRLADIKKQAGRDGRPTAAGGAR